MAGSVELQFSSIIEISQYIYLLRSGKLGHRAVRKSVRRAIEKYLNSEYVLELWKQSMCLPQGLPTMKDIMKLAHPRPNGTRYMALFGYWAGKPHSDIFLPPNLKEYNRTREALKAGLLADRLMMIYHSDTSG